MALTKKGTLKFGIGTDGLTVGATLLNVTSAEATSESTTNAIAKDSSGAIVAQVIGNTKNSLSVEGYGAAAPALGSDITVGGLTGLVLRSSVKGSNEDFVKYSAEAEGYPDIPTT